jgi:adenylylsulfate kinase
LVSFADAMEDVSKHIHPTFDQLLQRSDKEELLKQKATCLWLTGLSGSGKTTIAKGLEKKLHAEGFMTQLLDGDNVRTGLCKNLSFSIEDRQENIRRIAELNKLFLDAGVITISCFVSPTIEIREMAKSIIGSDFQEVFINTPLEVCESRDVKGLYAKARKGEIKNFTGIDSPFEAPLNPNIELKTAYQSIEATVEDLYSQIIQTIKFS